MRTTNGKQTTMQNFLLRAVAIVVSATFAAACAPQRPVFYPNEKLNSVGMSVAQQDVDDCIALARQAGAEGDEAKAVAGRTVTASAVGAAGGAAAGAVYGHAGRGAAAGAAGGAAGGLVSGLIKASHMDAITKRYVEACLQERGYRVIGWR